MATFDGKVKRLPVYSNDRQAWLKARRLGIGASDVAAIMGVDEYRGPLAVYEEKVSEAPPEDNAGEAARWGNIFEGPILLEYSRRTGRSIKLGGQLLQSKANPRWQVTLDAEQRVSAAPDWASGPGIAECKTVGYGNKAWEDELPRRVQVQMQRMNVPVQVIVGVSHNTSDYGDFACDRSQNLRWIVKHTRELCKQHNLEFTPASFEQMLAEAQCVDSY